MKTRISVIGQGYVGLPLAVAAAEAGFLVTGIDIDETKVKSIQNGISLIEDVSSERLSKQINLGRYTASRDFSVVSDSNLILICVPTPLNLEQKPDLSYVLNSICEISKYLKQNTLVILESTVEPGTTRNIVLPAILRESNLNIDQVELAFSPERIDPSNKIWSLENTPKIVSGINDKSRKRALEFYSKFIKTVISCDSPEIAETAKLLENSFRLINISFINEISIFCDILGIDIHKVIAAAKTKPYGFMAFFPSLGAGGHCIPVDPIYLVNKSHEIGAPSNLIELAYKINKEMPRYFVNKAEEKIGMLRGKKVLVVGVSYKPNVADTRDTPVKHLIKELENKGALVSWHDDLVKEWKGEKSVTLSNNYDLAILATPHAYIDLTKLGDVPILNPRGSI